MFYLEFIAICFSWCMVLTMLGACLSSYLQPNIPHEVLIQFALEMGTTCTIITYVFVLLINNL